MPSDDAISQILRDLVYVEQHGLAEDPLGRAVLRALQLGVNDSFVVGELKQRVAKHQQKVFREGVFPTPKLSAGEILYGKHPSGREVRAALSILNQHTMTVAGSGAGKTTRAQFVALQVAAHVDGMWLIDCRKAEWAKLRPLFQRLNIDLAVVNASSLRFNPLQSPAAVKPTEWIARVCDLLTMVLDLPPRASKVLQIAVHRLYHRAGILNGSQCYPTLFDLLELVKGDSQFNAQARSAVVDNLEAMFSSLGPEVLHHQRGWTTDALARFPINFVLGGVSESAQNLIINWLLLSEFSSRIARGVSNQRLDLYVSIDEGQRLLATQNSCNALADLWPLVRGAGLGVDVSVPSSFGLMPAAMSFTATKFLGRCGSAADYDLVANAMGLSREQRNWIFHNTRTGVFVAQIGDGNWRYPFVLHVPELRLPNIPGADREYLVPLAGLEVVPAGATSAPEVLPKNGAPQLDSRCRSLLEAVAAEPLLPSSQYPNRIGMSAKTVIELRRELVAAGWLRERRQDSSGRGRSSILLEITPEGLKTLNSNQGGASCS